MCAVFYHRCDQTTRSDLCQITSQYEGACCSGTRLFLLDVWSTVREPLLNVEDHSLGSHQAERMNMFQPLPVGGVVILWSAEQTHTLPHLKPTCQPSEVELTIASNLLKVAPPTLPGNLCSVW